MSEDDLRREASDPTISAARHAALWDDVPRSTAVSVALLRNPAVDPARLRTWLGHYTDAWYNPLVPLLLLTDPTLAQKAAWRLHMECDGIDNPGTSDSSLKRNILVWARARPGTDAGTRTRAFACHLAGLFGLPWP
ncbi:MAG: hypothetical protein EOO74_10305 [Myxococcales bacterium]|nr:MAG: hypothetical protein EOO74_10305 [Myxococcales bacterium]